MIEFCETLLSLLLGAMIGYLASNIYDRYKLIRKIEKEKAQKQIDFILMNEFLNKNNYGLVSSKRLDS
jgi:hypothetical protein